MRGDIYFFPNGVTFVSHDGEQQPDLQEPWAAVFAEWLEAKGIDPREYRVRMPDGRYARFFRTTWRCWNWRFEPLSSADAPDDSQPIEELDLGPRAYNGLKNSNIHTVAQLTSVTKWELLRVKNFGKTSLAEVERELGKLGLALQTSTRQAAAWKGRGA